MYANMSSNEKNFNNLNSIFEKIRDIFTNVKLQDNLSIEQLIQIYSNDQKFIKDLNFIKESFSDIEYILSPIDDLEEEFGYFLTVKRMISYLLRDIKFFIGNISFMGNLLINYFHLIHQKLIKNDDYDNECESFL